MGWFVLSGALIHTPEGFDCNLLEGCSWEREESGFPLRSVIQLQRHVFVERGVDARQALVIHQDLRKVPDIEEIEGRYRVRFVDSVETSYSYINILPRLIVTDNLHSRGFVKQTINKGMNNPDLASEIRLDTSQMAIDHRDHWTRKFADRVGRVNKGTLYGDGVEQDTIFGPELVRSTTDSVGWYTNYFGSLDKVKVSPKGSVTLFANPPYELFLRFLRHEIFPYIIAQT